MNFDPEIQRAAERHRQLLVEARILRLIRTSQAQHDDRAQATAAPRSESLLARVARMVRTPRAARA